MIKTRNQFFLVVALLLVLIGITLFTVSAREPEPSQLYPATINRDCAPWDGAAFTVSIPVQGGASIAISIYQSPEISSPATFSFPDKTGRIGSAFLLLPVGDPDELSGKVSFQRVEQGTLTEGRFELLTESGEPFKGRFQADWENEIVMCG